MCDDLRDDLRDALRHVRGKYFTARYLYALITSRPLPSARSNRKRKARDDTGKDSSDDSHDGSREIRGKYSTACYLYALITSRPLPPARTKCKGKVRDEAGKDSSDNSHNSSHDIRGKYSTARYLYALTTSRPLPPARSKRKADMRNNDARDDFDLRGKDHQAKRRRRLVPVPMVPGNIPLKKTWEKSELSKRKGLRSRFQVSPLSCHPIPSLILTGRHSLCCEQQIGEVGQLGRPVVEVERQGQKLGELDLVCV